MDRVQKEHEAAVSGRAHRGRDKSNSKQVKMVSTCALNSETSEVDKLGSAPYMTKKVTVPAIMSRGSS